MGDKFSDAGNAIRDFLAGIGDSLVDTVKGLLTLVVDLGLLYVHSECSRMTLGHVPETLDQEVEKIKQKYEPLLKDPVNTIGGIGQSICDTADEKGVAYSSGYIVTEVVTALLADKGLDKLKNVAKTGKTADNVADIAEGAGKAAENAAEDAAKAGKKLDGAAEGAESAAEDAGKVGESGSTSNTGVGNPVKVEGRGSTGRTIPNNLEEQMAMHQVRSDPLEGATELPIKLNDTRWKSSDGWVKMQSVVKTADGNKITIHYVYNKVTGTFDDFKFK